jgi:Na+-translocating ferredoxin:NAD+ oxidoreductase subunit B
MEKDIYENLRELLDRNPVFCPPAKEIQEILRILFTPEEAAVALGLSFVPMEVQMIAARAGVDPLEAGGKLESMADKGLVFAQKNKGAWGYALFNRFILFENCFRKGVSNETTEKLTPLWQRYLTILSPIKDYKPAPLARVIPLQKVIEPRTEVLSYERVFEMIDRAELVGITQCACRNLYQNCDGPREACMVFDQMCTHLVERGFARYLSKEEMKEKLEEFDQKGLVRMANNTMDRLNFICHCCSCCCATLRVLKESQGFYKIAGSSLVAENDPDLCLGCGICADKICPVQAIEMQEERPIVREEQCLGCGLCVTGCPNKARKMRPRIEFTEPFANLPEWGKLVLEEQGKLKAFMEVMNPAYRPKGTD